MPSMTTLPHAEHAVRRKAYSTHYIPSNLALFQAELQDLCLKLVDVCAPQASCSQRANHVCFKILGGSSGSGPVDCLDLFRHLMVDIIGTTVFGRFPGSLDNWAKNIQDPLATAVYDFPKRGIMVILSRQCGSSIPLKVFHSAAPYRPGLGTLSVAFPTCVYARSATLTGSWHR